MRVLLTGGRAPATLELARLLWRAGHSVHMAESVGWHLSRGSRALHRDHRVPQPAKDPSGFVEALEQIVRTERIDWLIPTCEEIFCIAAARDRLAALTRVLCPPLGALRDLHDKARFVERVRQHGLLAPATLRVCNRAQLDAALAQAWRDGRQVVLKPVFSRFAARVVLDPRQADDARSVQPTDQDPWLVQDLVAGRQRCTFGLARAGQLLAHAAYTTRYTLGLGATVHFVADPCPQVRAWVERFVAAEQFSGQIAFDLIEDADGRLWAIECNPRLTSGIHLLAHQADLVDAYLGADVPFVDTQGSRPAMLGTSMALALSGVLRRRQSVARWLGDWWQARDVAVDWRDPLPAVVSRFVWMVGVLARARRAGVNGQQAATADIEWNGAAFPPEIQALPDPDHSQLGEPSNVAAAGVGSTGPRVRP